MELYDNYQCDGASMQILARRKNHKGRLIASLIFRDNFHRFCAGSGLYALMLMCPLNIAEYAKTGKAKR